MKDAFQVGGIRAVVLFHVVHVAGVARTLDDEPSAPAHAVERLLHAFQVEARVLVECHAVGVGAVDEVTQVVASQDFQFRADVASCFERVLEFEVDFDALRADFLQQFDVALRVE